jgi:hypothetical protein
VTFKKKINIVDQDIDELMSKSMQYKPEHSKKLDLDKDDEIYTDNQCQDEY